MPNLKISGVIVAPEEGLPQKVIAYGRDPETGELRPMPVLSEGGVELEDPLTGFFARFDSGGRPYVNTDVNRAILQELWVIRNLLVEGLNIVTDSNAYGTAPALDDQI